MGRLERRWNQRGALRCTSQPSSLRHQFTNRADCGQAVESKRPIQPSSLGRVHPGGQSVRAARAVLLSCQPVCSCLNQRAAFILCEGTLSWLFLEADGQTVKVLRSLLEAAWASAVLRLGLEPMPGPGVAEPCQTQWLLGLGQPVSWKEGQAQAGGLGSSPALTSCVSPSVLRSQLFACPALPTDS